MMKSIVIVAVGLIVFIIGSFVVSDFQNRANAPILCGLEIDYNDSSEFAVRDELISIVDMNIERDVL